jgi:hypothetical protein
VRGDADAFSGDKSYRAVAAPYACAPSCGFLLKSPPPIPPPAFTFAHSFGFPLGSSLSFCFCAVPEDAVSPPRALLSDMGMLHRQHGNGINSFHADDYDLSTIVVHIIFMLLTLPCSGRVPTSNQLGLCNALLKSAS